MVTSTGEVVVTDLGRAKRLFEQSGKKVFAGRDVAGDLKEAVALGYDAVEERSVLGGGKTVTGYEGWGRERLKDGLLFRGGDSEAMRKESLDGGEDGGDEKNFGRIRMDGRRRVREEDDLKGCIGIS